MEAGGHEGRQRQWPAGQRGGGLGVALAPGEGAADPDRRVARASPDRFPALRRALSPAALDTEEPMDKELTFGLERVLDGISVLIAAAEGK